MKKLLFLAAVFVSVVAWRIGEFISHDALILLVGILIGVLAAIPMGLLLLASQRRHEPDYNGRRIDERPQPPIVVLGSHAQQPQSYQQPYQHQAPPWGATGGGNYHMLPGPPQDRRFDMDTPADIKQKWGGR